MRYQYHSSRCRRQAHASAESNKANYRVRPRFLLVIFNPCHDQSTQRRLLEADSCGRRALFGHIRVRRQQINATVLPVNLGLVQIFTPFKAFPRECHLTLGRYAWGYNEFSNTADAQSTDSSNKICSPVSKSFFYAEHSSEGGKDAAVHVVAVAAGAALDVKGKLYMWGCNEKSQCGNGALLI